MEFGQVRPGPVRLRQPASDSLLAGRCQRVHLAVRPDRNFGGRLRGLPRVRIGSVDGFQGREFDVVFLSTTRSSRSSRAGAQGPNRFGFLVLPNRLCVAMSRQRKLLVAVGDAAMMTSAEGRAAVPTLAAFHD